MAICKCGNEDKGLPKKWQAWECPQCFCERAITYTSPIIPEFANSVIYDLESRLMFFNMAVVDMKMDIALGKAEQ